MSVTGSGLLAGTVAGELADRGYLVVDGDASNGNGTVRGHAGPGGGAAAELVVVASDAWDTSGHDAARHLAAAQAARWLPVYTDLAAAIAGPLEEPGRAGCGVCAASRRRRLLPDRAERAAAWREHGGKLATRPASLLTGLAAELVAMLVADDLAALAAGRSPRTRRALLRVDLTTLAVTRHRFLPEPGCRVCGAAGGSEPGVPEVTPVPGAVARPAYRPDSFRVRPVADELDELVDTYVDPRVGLVRSIDEWREGALLIAAAPIGLRTNVIERGFGRSTSFRESQLTALLEALERLGSAPAGGQTTVTGSLAELRGDALDPRTLGLYPPERYDLPGFRFQPFTDDQPYRWVWGWSFARQRPVLVPEFYAYYGRRQDPSAAADHAFVYEISNGCALGGCLEEAILYGLLEVAERDAFLLTWYARLPASAIAVDSATDRTLPMHIAAIRAETGYEVSLLDITVEQGIPCVWALARNPRPGDGRPAVVCAAGSHPRPERAIRNALAELTPSLGHLLRRYAEPGEAERARRMVEDPGLVQHMEDHSLLYADPIAADRLAFLTEGDRWRKPVEVGGPPLPDADLRDALLAAVGRYTARGLDVVAVDQTSAEHRAGGFHCVKVIVPGTLPMTFGHPYRRIDGLHRLYEVPRLLGYRDGPLPPREVNPHPHPFP